MPVRRKKKPEEIGSVSKSSLFKRYFLIIVAIVLVCLFALGISMLLLVTNYWWNEKFELLDGNSGRIISLAVEKDIFGSASDADFDEVGYTLDLISGSTKADFFICDTDGKIVVCRHTTVSHSVSACQEHSEIMITDEGSEKFLTKALRKNGFTGYTRLNGTLINNSFVVANPIMADDVAIGAIFAVEDAVSGLLPYIESITKMFLISAFLSLIIAFISSYVFSYGVAKPLAEMTEATRFFARGEFTHKVRETHKKDEMRELAVALNKMAYDLNVEDKAQKSFVANVSHELKTPMTTIGGFIDGILDGTIPEERQKEYLSTVSAEVKRLARLVVAMLNLSKIESGEFRLKPVRYDISAQIFETMLSFEHIIDSRAITVEGFEEMSGVTVCGDRDLLHQVIYNLIDNAVKFTPDGGVISLYASNDGKNTLVRIRNSGAGVSKEELQRIFERFYKVDKSRSYDTNGVGLGLYIVKTIVNMHSGTLNADSRLGEYTQFTVVIPDTPELQ